MLNKRYWKVHDFDFIQVRYLNKDKELKFVDKRNKQMLVHGKDVIDKLPPSFKHRETIYFDRTKPIPKQILELDQEKAQNIKRYKMRYLIEKKFRIDDI